VPTVNTRFRTAILAVAALGLVATACGDDDAATSSPVVSDPWVREPAAGATATAAYAVITNDGDEAITLVGASSPLTDVVEIHETSMADDGTMSMREKEGGFVIEAGDSLVMEPGGAHVMMLDVDPADVTGEIEITYDFDGADPVTVQAPVQPLPTGDDMAEMDHDDSGDMDDTDGDMDDTDGDMDDTDGDMDDMGSDTTEG
jgi:copper(I)-binding protein